MCRSFAVSALVVLTGCGAATTSGSTSASCTIEQGDAGVAVLVCKDGTRSVIRPHAPSASPSCSVREVDSGVEIRCPDGTHAFVSRVPANGLSDAGNDATSDAGNDAASDGQVECPSDLASDPQNCGACGNACPAPDHTEARCLGGACAPFACMAGYEDCNGDPTDGCEAELARDPTNCGACGTDCLRAGCFDATCGDVPELLGGDPGLTALAQDSSRIYALSCNWMLAPTITTYSKTDKAWAPLMSEPNCFSTAGIAFDGTNVYYVNGLGHISRVPAAGGAPTLFHVMTGVDTIIALTANNHHLYYASQESARPDAIRRIHAIPTVTGGAAFSISTAVTDIDTDSGFLYWIGAAPPGFSAVGINRVQEDGGTPVSIAKGSDRAGILHVRAVGPWVTWNELLQVPVGTFSSEYRMLVRKAPSSGGTSVTLADLRSNGGAAFDVDASAVYTESKSRILKVPLSGKAPAVIALTIAPPSVLLVDDTHLYWLEDGALWRLKKP